MSRIFVLEPTEYSLAKAKRFGELVFLFGDEGQHPAWHSPDFVEAVYDALESRHFDPTRDYLAVSGRMISVAILVGCVARVFDNLRLLCFDHSPEIRHFRVVELSCVKESNT